MTQAGSVEVQRLVAELAQRRTLPGLKHARVLSLSMLSAGEALRSALDRACDSLQLALKGCPIRDLSETLAEAESARRAHDAAVFDTTAKYCPWCKTKKTREQFHKNRRAGDGLSGYCSDCDNLRARCDRDAGIIRKSDPKKIKARSRVNAAIVSGRLVRPSECQACLSTGAIHAHHHDYDKPLDVAWLCVQCHAEAHNAL